MNLARFFGAALIVATAAIGVANAGDTPAASLSGDQILARAGAASGLTSYSVPVHFDVHMHHPVGIGAGVDGVVSYQAPSQAVLTITKMPGIMGKFFKSSYAIDLAPQVWPLKYEVQSVSQAKSGDSSVYVLQAVAKTDPTIASTVFTVAQDDYQPVSAVWSYKDGSSIRLSMVNQRASSYMLPHTESIAVSMPKYSLDATATYGAYAINAGH